MISAIAPEMGQPTARFNVRSLIIQLFTVAVNELHCLRESFDFRVSGRISSDSRALYASSGIELSQIEVVGIKRRFIH